MMTIDDSGEAGRWHGTGATVTAAGRARGQACIWRRKRERKKNIFLISQFFFFARKKEKEEKENFFCPPFVEQDVSTSCRSRVF